MKDMLQAVVFGGLFLIPFLPLYVENDFFFPFITGKNFAFRIIVEIVFASWILLALHDVKYRPKFSWIIAGFASLLGVMLVANALGEYPLKSFWSNFERMDGYITLVHVFLYTVVLGSVLTTHKLWSYFLHTSIVVSFLVALHGLTQQAEILGGDGSRIDSRLGNAAYMAVYMLFHIFFVGFLAVRSKVTLHRVLYGLIGVVFIYTLLLTGTRGTFLGFIGGSMAMVAYIALFGRKVPQLRMYAAGGIFTLVVLALVFMGVRDSDFVQDGPMARLANIDIQSDLVVRSTIWGMAWDGVKERPLLGYGQGNFNYVFNEKYEASLHAQEQWFDRVHNIFFDWLIAGGFLGFFAYFSIMLAVVYYLVIVPVALRRQSPFSTVEQAVLVGLLVGYLMHNLVVFDNIISYIFYGTMLALIHSRVGEPMKAVQSFTMDKTMIMQFAAPIVILVTGFSVYFVNYPGIHAAGDMIDALVTPDVPGRLQEFHDALEQDSFANQEIVEQLAQQAMNVVRAPSIDPKDRNMIVQRSELELLQLIEQKPGDARLHNFLGTFYRSINALPEARQQAAIARSLSPNKPSLVVEQAIIEIQSNQPAAARDFMKTAFELAPENTQVRTLYAAMLMNTGDGALGQEILDTDAYLNAYAMMDFGLAAAENAGDLEFLAKLFELRVKRQPAEAQHRASLAFVYYKLGEIDKSVAMLTKAGEDIPDFAPLATCYVANLEAGNTPDEGCN